MKLNELITLIEQYPVTISIIILILSACIRSLYKLYRKENSISESKKFEHENNITEKIRGNIQFGSSVILADVKKYSTNRNDGSNKKYTKQGAEFYNIIPKYGVQFILMPSTDEYIPVGLVPFEWIEYIRDHDSEDNKAIIGCKFNGVIWYKKSWYKKFKSPFIEIEKYIKNPSYTYDQPNSYRYKRK